MEELKKPVRTTIYLDEETMRRCQALFEEAKTDTFSAFVRNALNCYIDYLVTDQPHSFISEELAKTIRDEVRPIASRVSKGLYRYAVLIDMLCQIIAYQDTEWSEEQLEYVRKFANARVARSKGKVVSYAKDLKKDEELELEFKDGKVNTRVL